MMKIYCADTFETELPEQANLVITSPSNQILMHQAIDLFYWLDCHVLAHGILIIDVPGEYGESTVPMWEGQRKTDWKFHWGTAIRSLYKRGDAQSLCAYTRVTTEVSRPRAIKYRECYNREMSHPCEFDSVLISELIHRYSKPGDTILDPFCGTGMVPRLAHQLGRTGIGIDLRCPYTNKL